jgi:cytochrome c peroxidase
VVELRSWPVADGPAGLAVDEPRGRLVVWSQRAHVATVLDTTGRDLPRKVALVDRSRLSPEIAAGRALFAATADPRIANDGRACESCHPDGRQDALVWSTPQGPRQTPMLAGRIAGTAPYGWSGDAKDLRAHLKRTVERLHGAGLPDDARDQLIAYVESLVPPAPPAEDAKLVAEGEALFHSSAEACAVCHGDDGRHPDGLTHDVGGDQQVDTPSLASLAGTAPYYHDGRFATLRDLLVATRGHMGGRRKLTRRELDALEAFLRSL